MDFKRSNVMDRERESLQKASSFAEIPNLKYSFLLKKRAELWHERLWFEEGITL